MLDSVLSILGCKKYHHQFLIFGLPDEIGLYTMLFSHLPDNTIEVSGVIPSLPYECEFLGEVNLFPNCKRSPQVEEIVEALVADDPKIKRSMLRLFEGIRTRTARTEGAQPQRVYLGKITTYKKSLVSPIRTITTRGYMVY